MRRARGAEAQVSDVPSCASADRKRFELALAQRLALESHPHHRPEAQVPQTVGITLVSRKSTTLPPAARNLATSISTIGLNGAANLTAHSSDAVVEMYWDPRHFELFPRSTCSLTLQIAAGSFGCLFGCRPPPVRTWLCLFVALYMHTQGTIDMIRQG